MPVVACLAAVGSHSPLLPNAPHCSDPELTCARLRHAGKLRIDAAIVRQHLLEHRPSLRVTQKLGELTWRHAASFGTRSSHWQPGAFKSIRISTIHSA